MTYATPDFAYVRALANAREAIAKAVKAAKPGTMTLTTRARSTRGYDATLDVLTACVSGIDDERARTEDLRVVLVRMRERARRRVRESECYFCG